MTARETKTGYTIIEVMIFLAVSGFMFLIAANFISGKQANAEFNQGLNNLAAEIQQNINDVSNGYYSSSEKVTCTINASNKPEISATATDTERGTNNACVYMGKLFQFNAGGDPQMYKINSIVGRKLVLGGTTISDVPKTYSEALPNISSTLLTETKKMQWGLKVVKVSSATTDNIRGFAVMSGFASGSDESGSQIVKSLPIESSSLAADITDISSLPLDTYANGNGQVKICVIGGNDKYGLITIGSSGQKSTVTKKVLGTGGASQVECQPPATP